ncbi:MAG: hypothetical protein ACOZAM_19455 [Pseudomonadota bacterium]
MIFNARIRKRLRAKLNREIRTPVIDLYEDEFNPPMTRKASHKMIALSAANALPFKRQGECGPSSMCVISKDYLLTHPAGQNTGILD